MNETSEALLARVRALLDGHVQDPSLEARAIVEFTKMSEESALALAKERALGRPLAYVLGKKRFMGVDLVIAPGALVPREETELLGNTALDALDALDGMAKGGTEKREMRLIDMCCGSGNLACALAVRMPSLRVWASDLTDGAVAVARDNVKMLTLEDRVRVVQGDLFTPLGGLGLEGLVDVVVCNPPYISTGRLGKDRAELLAHEPREAFDGGPYGVSIQQRVVKDALPFLRPGGVLMFEIGAGQERQVELLFKRTRAYVEIEERRDASDQPRVILGRKAG